MEYASDSPQDLLETIKSSHYAKQHEDGKLLGLAEASIDAIMRFDKEIAMVMQGISNATLGISCIVWGGLGIVFHVRNMHHRFFSRFHIVFVAKLTSHALSRFPRPSS